MRVREWMRQHGIAALAGLVMTAMVLVAQVFNLAVGERAWLLLSDTYARAAPRPWQDAAVRVVDIDDDSIRRLGQWPWPRTDLARLTDRLAAAGASAIAYDVVFSEPDRTSPAALGEQLRRQGAGPAAIKALAALPYIAEVYTREELLATSAQGETTRDLMRRSYRADGDRDVVFALKPNFLSKAGSGTSHGLPYRYDMHVPQLWFGAGVPRGQVRKASAVGGCSSTESTSSRSLRCGSSRHARQAARKLLPRPKPVSAITKRARPRQRSGRPLPARKTWRACSSAPARGW